MSTISVRRGAVTGLPAAGLTAGAAGSGQVSSHQPTHDQTRSVHAGG